MKIVSRLLLYCAELAESCSLDHLTYLTTLTRRTSGNNHRTFSKLSWKAQKEFTDAIRFCSIELAWLFVPTPNCGPLLESNISSRIWTKDVFG